MNLDEISKYRLTIVPLNCFSLDRFDLHSANNGANDNMDRCQVRHWSFLKRVAKYLKDAPRIAKYLRDAPRIVQKFKWQTAMTIAIWHIDSDLGRRPETANIHKRKYKQIRAARDQDVAIDSTRDCI